jgi:hypothetical protein
MTKEVNMHAIKGNVCSYIKWIFKKQDVRVWTGINRPRIYGPVNSYEASGF